MTRYRKLHASLAMLWGAVLAMGLIGTDKSFGAPASGLARSHSGGGVTVTVTYLNPQSTEDARFQLVLDTHTVNLDNYYLKNLSLLHDDKGQMYEPKELESKGSGHHREITLIFPKPSPDAKRLDLVIKEIAGIEKRSFRWELP